MDQDDPFIIKVKCGELIRRISCTVNNEGIVYMDLVTLRNNIRSAFQIARDSDFNLRYIDEEGDVVTLIDHSDFADAVAQNLNPLRINVVLETDSESSSQIENLSSSLDHANGEVLKSNDLNDGDVSSVHEFFSSRFVVELNGSDYIHFAPNAMFTKHLTLCNDGARAWPCKSKLVWIGGDLLTDEISVDITKIPVDGLPVGKKVDVAMNIRAPKHPGKFTCYWKMSLPTGETFGERIWVRVQVYDPSKHSKEFDLNYPPPVCLEDDDHLKNMTAKSRADRENDDLRVIEDMGFKVTSLNKDILRLNSNDLAKTLTDLYAISDWYAYFAAMEAENNKLTKVNSDAKLSLENIKNSMMLQLVSRKTAGVNQTTFNNLTLGPMS